MSDERLECRLKKDIKIILQKAANIMGITLSEFVVNAACSRAYELVRDHTIINAHMENMENIVQSLMQDSDNVSCANCEGTGWITQTDGSIPVRCGYGCYKE